VNKHHPANCGSLTLVRHPRPFAADGAGNAQLEMRNIPTASRRARKAMTVMSIASSKNSALKRAEAGERIITRLQGPLLQPFLEDEEDGCASTSFLHC